jgi:hypothetical protein
MKKWLVLLLLIASPCFSDVEQTINKIIEPQSWLTKQYLKWGYVTAICAQGTLDGLCEGYKFSQEPRHIVNENNYHIYVTGRDVAGFATGWFAYANVRDGHQGRVKKALRIVGGALWRRNAKEWSYKAQRYGNPFDYSVERNSHAIVYFGIRSDKIIDLYIGTGPKSGPIVDAACLVLGRLFIQ